MNSNPIKLIKNGNDKAKLIEIMVENKIHQLPLVDERGKIVGLQTIDELLHFNKRDNLVVIMSGGIGKRLQPLTNDVPKPMLLLGGKPLLEVILEKLHKQGFNRFCFTVGYKAEMIMEYFGDGKKWDVSIDYIHEEKPLGTAGALYVLENKEKLPIVVINGDLLTTINFNHFLDFHYKSDADCTMCIREFDYQLPYGVVEIKNNQVTQIQEKPIYKHFVNAGMYVLNPELLKHIPKNEFYLMTQYLEKLVQIGHKVKAFPLIEYWSDIGQLPDYEKACREFDDVMLS